MKQPAGKIVRIIGVFAVVLFVSSGIAAQENFNKDERLQIKRGASSVATRGYVGGEAQDRYRIRVAAGREMIVRVFSKENNADFSVCEAADEEAVCASSEAATDGKGGKLWNGRIVRGGDYYIFVTAYPGAARYTLRVTVKR